METNPRPRRVSRKVRRGNPRFSPCESGEDMTVPKGRQVTRTRPSNRRAASRRAKYSECDRPRMMQMIDGKDGGGGRNSRRSAVCLGASGWPMLPPSSSLEEQVRALSDRVLVLEARLLAIETRTVVAPPSGAPVVITVEPVPARPRAPGGIRSPANGGRAGPRVDHSGRRLPSSRPHRRRHLALRGRGLAGASLRPHLDRDVHPRGGRRRITSGPSSTGERRSRSASP